MTDKTKIIVIQHCQAEHHINNLTGGWTNTALTDTGKKQAGHLAQRIENIQDINEYKIYTSDLLRAQQTAKIINKVLNLAIISDKRLREINNGDAAGKTKEWAGANQNPQTKGSFNLDVRYFKNGETWREFYLRISGFMETLSEAGSKKSILVTHGCALNYIISWWMHFNVEMLEYAYFSADPGSVSVLSENSWGQNSLLLMNCTKHLQ